MKTYFKLLITFFLLISYWQPAWSSNAKLTNLRFATYPDKTRLVFNVTNPIRYAATLIATQLTLDLKNTLLATQVKKLHLSKTPLVAITSDQRGNNLSLVLKLKNPQKMRHFFLTKPNRLVIDLYSTEIAWSKPELKEPQVILKSPPTITQLNVVSDTFEQELIRKMDTVNDNYRDLAENDKLRKIMIVIDPGHGGRDSGAVGANGTREKDVTLSVGKALKRILNDTEEFQAILTRNSDYFIPLRERLGIAHAHKADLFVSIHADAYKTRDVRGASVFALSQRGATSEAARWLAEKENESELGQAMLDKSELLRSVLIDLAQTATISSSLDLGKRLLRGLSDIGSLHTHRVEQAAFVVLKSPDIPSLLVEVGFISNDIEESKLRSSSYQEQIADQLAMGIKSYFSQRPPPGTQLASLKPGFNAKPMTLGDSLPGA